ncbi:GSCFA domain-containing protein [Prevotella sp. E2-28]|uniref:GSCFA domain-containing protein n=1 Tax=Prevotella sp. E2-28 TaxID=2913620 RepID=UPI001EDB0D7C|nr:GSCFA domain-containing protein [Prevotella sp. E2-28]UKK54978.1 GSCFA domain-containing protein [Prevotella sp. E2-28]
MEFRTIVKIPKPDFLIEPLQPILFVGSCFADKIGRRFEEERFPVTVNPFGVMYNPASILHTVQRCDAAPHVAFFTLGTNHIYRLKETGEIVDNCQKRPQNLFQEEELTIAQCVDYLSQAAEELYRRNPDVHIVLTVSPIRYAKYGYHGSQLSKATLLLAANQLANEKPFVSYFPAYEIVLDELRDYRFYQPDMLHPSDQAVEYIWQQFVEAYFCERAKQFLQEWKPIKEALAHRPFNPESDAYRQFMEKTLQQEKNLMERYSNPCVAKV